MPIIDNRSGGGYIAYHLPLTQGEFPVASLPPSLRGPVIETSTILRLPLGLCAHAALGVVSLVCQRFVKIQCPPYDPAPVSLYLLLISTSGGGKSPLLQRLMRSVMAFERKQRDNLEVAISKFQAQLAIWKDDGRRLAKEYREAALGSLEEVDIRARRIQHEQERPVKPRLWEFRYEELSPQGLRDALVANQAVGIVSAEGGDALLGMTFSQPPMMNGYWSGEDRPVGLVSGNRRPVDPSLTILLMTQEGRFISFMKSRGTDAFSTGLLARTLVMHSHDIELPVASTPAGNFPEPQLDLFNQRLGDILSQALSTPLEPLLLKSSKEATCCWLRFKEAVHNKLICGNFSEEMKSFFRKIAQHATRVAALFHYFEGERGEISVQTMKCAIELCEWYLFEWLRIFSAYAPSQWQKDMEASEKLLQWLCNAHAKPTDNSTWTQVNFSERDINNYGPIRRNPEILSRAIDALIQQGIISISYGKKGGRIISYPPQISCNFPGQTNSQRPVNLNYSEESCPRPKNILNSNVAVSLQQENGGSAEDDDDLFPSMKGKSMWDVMAESGIVEKTNAKLVRTNGSKN